jgi:NodT family efflux transporter outer membrane factor (OMF) lipoprotein
LPLLAVAAFVAMVVGGCAIAGPDYARPVLQVSEAWHSEVSGGLSAEQVDPQTLASWWTVLGDAELDSLMERAAQANLDLKQARVRIREARARRGAARADLLPTLEAGASATASRSSDRLGGGGTSEMYAANLDASWELDIFGGARRSVEAYSADLQAAQEDLRDVLVSMLAEVALNYVDVRTSQARLAAAEENLAAQQESYQLAQWRRQAGLSDELSVQQARYNLESTRAQIPSLRMAREEAMNRIAVLLGQEPGALHAELQERQPIPSAPATVTAGVPADALRNRPDVRRSERQLAAQTARIGVAVSDLYPKFRLSGVLGLEALSLDKLFSAGSETGDGGGVISWSLFRGGAVRRNIEVQRALQEEYLIAYQTAVLGALEEAENALVAYAQEQERRQALRSAADAALQASELANQKYQAGLADFSSVLDAQRSLLSFQDQLAQSEGTVAADLIRLYKALGGGWTSRAPEAGDASPQGEKNDQAS